MLDRVGGFMREVGLIVRSHHERWDGGGYPDGLAGEQIPLEARIIACCDTWNAMRTDRPYRKALAYEIASAELSSELGDAVRPEARGHAARDRRRGGGPDRGAEQRLRCRDESPPRPAQPAERQPVQMQPVRHRGGLRAAAHAELAEDPRDVHAGRLLGHEQRRADLAVGRALGDQREHLALARGQAERVLAGAV